MAQDPGHHRARDQHACPPCSLAVDHHAVIPHDHTRCRSCHRNRTLQLSDSTRTMATALAVPRRHRPSKNRPAFSNHTSRRWSRRQANRKMVHSRPGLLRSFRPHPVTWGCRVKSTPSKARALSIRQLKRGSVCGVTEDAAELILALLMLLALGLVFILRADRIHSESHRPVKKRLLDLEMRALLFLAAIALVIVPIIDVLVPLLEFADYRFRGTLAWIGVGMAAISIWLVWCSRFDLEHFEGQGAPAPLQGGIHRFVRHPIYSALLLWTAAQWLLSQNMISGGMATLAVLSLYVLRVPRDEQTRLEKFGHSYLEYMERTGSVLPRLRRTYPK